MDADITDIIRLENPWIEDPAAWERERSRRLPPRPLVRRQAGLGDAPFETDTATLLIGPRQAGKSTWVWTRLFDDAARVLYLDCEQPAIRRWCADVVRFSVDVRSLGPGISHVFLNEVQALDEAGLFLKGVVERRPGVRIIATGSSAFHLLARTRESLAGRARRLRLLPLTLEEVTSDLDAVSPLIRPAALRDRLLRHLTVGGYPRVWQSSDASAELTSLIEAFVIRDASDRFRIERPDALRTLLRLAALQCGSLANASEWASIAGVSVSTVSSYLNVMEESLLIRQVPVFAGGKRAEVTSARKVFFLDVGLRNRLVGELRPFEERGDRGAVLETWVFSELAKGLPFDATIAYWRTRSGAEVDFIVRDESRFMGIEVKASALGRPTLSRSARSFIEAYAPATFFVVNLALEHAERIGDTAVRWLPPWQLPSAIAARAR